MAVKGIFASDQNIVGSRVGDFASGILQIWPTGSAPLFALTSGMESAPAQDTIVHWFEENKLQGRTDVTGFAAGNGDSDPVQMNVTDGTQYVPGAVLLNESTGEYLFVTAVAGNQVTATRGFGGTTQTTIVVGHFMQKIGTAYEEGSSRPVAVANLGYPRFNPVQIFRNAWDITRTATRVQYHTGDIVAKNKADCALLHAEDIEKSLIWGVQSIGILNNKPFRTMDGLNKQIQTNVTTAGATTNWTQLQAFFQTIFTRNVRGKPNERIAFLGNDALRVINEIAVQNSVMNITVAQTDFGIQVSTLITPFGTVNLMTHPLMVENPVWTKDMYVYHPGAIRTRYLTRTEIEEYGRFGGDDSEFGVYTTEMCGEYKAEITGGQLLGLTAGAQG